MKLYNTLTRKVENFKPLKADTVRMYSCGPTVYNHIHIGNLSSFIYADTLRRVLVSQGWQVKQVMNYTDVDDKTIRRSREEFPAEEPGVALRNLTEKYEEIFSKDMDRIGNDTKDVTFVKATDKIDEMKLLISKLLHEGFAYIAEDGIYFSIAKYRESGKTYGQLLKITESNTSEARIQNDEYDKDSVHDFALWKKRRGDEPFWPFDIDGQNMSGRPGWHIECSAMSHAELGQPFDIHTGGIDLIFPHHENEIAQSTAGEDNPFFATTFFHNEHLLVDGKKMSKSLNNFFTLDDIKKKGFDPLAFRLLVLQSHYRYQSNFNWDTLESATNSLTHIRQWSDLRFQSFSSVKLTDYYKKVKEKVSECLSSDLRIPDALTYIYGAISKAEELGPDGNAVQDLVDFIDQRFAFGLTLRRDTTADQKKLIQEREQARNDKNWDESDRLRKELEKQKLGINDTNYGPIWYRLA